MWAPQTLDVHRIFQVTGLCVPEWVLNFLFQTSVISSRVHRVHDTNTSGSGGVDLKYSSANMLGAAVALAAGKTGGDLIGGPIWGFACHHTASPADFSCASKLGAPSPAQRHLVAFSPTMRGAQSLDTAASHAENVKRVEILHFLKETVSPIKAGLCQTPCPPRKEILKPSSERQALLLQPGVEDGSRAMEPDRAGSEHTFYRFLAFWPFLDKPFLWDSVFLPVKWRHESSFTGLFGKLDEWLAHGAGAFAPFFPSCSCF